MKERRIGGRKEKVQGLKERSVKMPKQTTYTNIVHSKIVLYMYTYIINSLVVYFIIIIYYAHISIPAIESVWVCPIV